MKTFQICALSATLLLTSLHCVTAMGCQVRGSEHAGDGARTASPDGRQLLYSDDFKSQAKLEQGYNVERGLLPGAWTVKDGILVGRQVKSDHGAVIRRNMDFTDVDIEFDVRFNGGTRFNFVLDDQKEKSVHASHICRVSVSPKRVTVTDDKTGNMNLEIRAQRKDKSLPSKEKKKLEKLLKTKQASTPIKLKKGEWCHVRILLVDDRLSATINNDQTVSLKSAGIGHPNKSKFGMTVNGDSIDFKNLRVYAVETK